MSIFKKILDNFKGGIKDALFQKLVRKEAVVVKDVQTSLLEGKHAFITGGTSGIGYAIAAKMVESGANVTIVGRNEARAKEYSDKLGCRYMLIDIADVPSLIKRMEEYLGNNKIDILVNCAGMRDHEEWLKKTPENFDRVMDLNLKSVYFLCQTVASDMIKKGLKGHILNISSSSSMRPGWGPYQLSKVALNALTKGFAHQLACHGITVNGLAPGVTATPMVEDVLEPGNLAYPNTMRRAQTPEEIANLAVFLASDLGNSIIGDTVFMTGGSGIIDRDV